MKLLNYFGLFTLFILFGVKAISQDKHFVYLQTENKQQFYIEINSSTLKSSATGYLIIPKLTDGDYTFILGFPKAEYDKQKLSFTVAGKDAGYLIKNFGKSGWGLFNLNSMKVTMATPSASQELQSANNTDDFTKSLSGVVNTDLSSNKNSVPQDKNLKRVKLLSTSKNNSGREMIYIVANGGSYDTVSVFMPAPSGNEISTSETTIANTENSDSQKNVAAEPEEIIKIKSSNTCKNIASDKDFLKMRKQMASKSSEEGMVQASQKEFKKKCFSVANIQNLSMLFFTDKGRYDFYDAAYSHVYDLENFASLKSNLKDSYYITRFEAMLR